MTAPVITEQDEATSSGGRRVNLVRFITLLAVLGPGLIAGLSDDDPAGITTYSVQGTEYGYQLLWVLLVSTIALVLFQSLGARIGVVTGQGLAGLIRQKYGARAATVGILALLVANMGTTAAEFAGIAARLRAVRRQQVPVSACRRSRRDGIGFARRVPRRRADPARAVGGVHVLHRRRGTGSPRLAGRGQGPAHPDAASDQGSPADLRRHSRHHPGPLGAVVHPVLRRRQAPDPQGPALPAHRRDHRRCAHRRHRVLRRDRLRRHPARPRRHDQRRSRRRRSPQTPRRGTGHRTVRHRPHRRSPAGRLHPAADHRLRRLRPHRPARGPRRRHPRRSPLLRHHRPGHHHRNGPGPDPRRTADPHPCPDPGRQRDPAAAPAGIHVRHLRDRDLMGSYAATRAAASAYLVAIALITACILTLGYLTIF